MTQPTYLSFLFSKNRWSEAFLANGRSEKKRTQTDGSETHYKPTHKSLIFWNNRDPKKLPQITGLDGVWGWSWTELLAVVGMIFIRKGNGLLGVAEVVAGKV